MIEEIRIDPFNLPGLVAALSTALKTGLLDSVLRWTASPEMYAAEIKVDPAAVKLLLDVLVEAGVLEKLDDDYRASSWLKEMDGKLPGGVVGDSVVWGGMYDFARYGYRRNEQTELTQDEIYVRKVFEVENLYADLAKRLAELLEKVGSILDIGAGSGVWSRAMKYDDHLTLFDKPRIIEELRRRSGFERRLEDDRIVLLEGDYWDLRFDPANPFGKDRIVLANVLHLEPEPFSLIKRWVAGLKPKGEVVVIDNFGLDKLGVKLYEIHLAMRSREAKNHSLDEIKGWFRDLGFWVEQVHYFSSPGTLGAVVFRKA